MALTERDRSVLRSFAHRINPSDAGAHNNLGALYFQKGLVDEAVELFSRALELDPKMLVTQRNLEIAHKRSGHYERRVTELRERLRSDPDDRDARWELGRSYSSLAQHDAAANEFQVLVSQNRNDVAAIIQLAMAEKSRGQLKAATEWLLSASEVDSTSSVIQFYLGETLYSRGVNAEALAALQRAVELSPEYAEAHYLMAFVLGDLGRHEEARGATKKAIQLNPAYGQAQTNLSLERLAGRRESAPYDVSSLPDDEEGEAALAHHNLGLAFRQQGYYAEALREYRLALERGEDRQMINRAIAEVYLIQGDYDSALELYNTLVREVPDSAKFWNERGVVLHQLGRPDEAINSFRNAVERKPGYALALNNQAVAKAQLGRPEEAVTDLTDAVKNEPSMVMARLNLGLLLFSLQRYHDALEVYRMVLERDRSVATAWNGVGLILNELDKRSDARNAFARAVEADPEMAEAHYNLSFAQSALGDYDGALRTVSRAQGLDPYYVPQKYRLAIDLQYEDPTISVIPEISADVTAETTTALEFDQQIVDKLFAELDRPPVDKPADSANDPLALARDYLNKGLLDLAAAETDRAIRRGVETAEAQLLSAHVHARRGLHGEALERYRVARSLAPRGLDARLGEVRQLLALGRGNEALGDATALAEEWPEDVDVLVVLAEVRLASGDPAHAMESLRLARGRAPQRADILKLEGDVAADMGDFESARRAYEGALDLDPRFAQVRVDLGRIHEAREDWSAAEASYRAALESLPTLSEAALALARVYRRAEQPKIAVNLLVDLLESNPADLEALVALGHSLLDDGRVNSALQAFERVLAYDDTHVAGRFFAGVALGRLRRYHEAVKEWERVIALQPDGPFAREARKHVRSALDLNHIFQSGGA